MFIFPLCNRVCWIFPFRRERNKHKKTQLLRNHNWLITIDTQEKVPSPKKIFWRIEIYCFLCCSCLFKWVNVRSVSKKWLIDIYVNWLCCRLHGSRPTGTLKTRLKMVSTSFSITFFRHMKFDQKIMIVCRSIPYPCVCEQLENNYCFI